VHPAAASDAETMFSKLIVGLNGEAPGRDALALASILARPAQADILAVGVYPDPLMPFPIVLSRHATAHEECERQLRADRDRIAAGARIHAIPGVSPARALRHAAVQNHADLLVLGSAAGTTNSQVRAGHHARQLLHDSPCAVAIAPAGFATQPGEIHRIAVGFDGSQESRDALDLGRTLANATGARLRVLTAVEAVPPIAGAQFDAMAVPPADWDEVVDLRRRLARQLLDEAVPPADDVDTEVVDGDPGRALCEASRDSDLLIVGSRRWGPLARLVLGGTGEHVLRHAHSPVLIVPRRETEAPDAGHHGLTVSAS
jgi:nucleotide-binding universal stress UspA family protein